MTPEVKIRTAASQDPTLQGYLGGSPFTLNGFRWFDTQIEQSAIKLGACVRAFRVSTIRTYSFQGIQNISQPRFQFDVLSPDPELARTIAAYMIQWLGTVSFGNISTQFANFVLNQRSGMDYQLQPPVFVQTLDVRIWNLEQ